MDELKEGCIIQNSKKNALLGKINLLKIRELLTIIIQLVCALLLFFTNEAIQPDKKSKALLLLLTFFSGFTNCYGKGHLQKYRSNVCKICIFLISTYASLASFGQRFFLNGDVRIHFSLEGILYCVLGIIWFIPIICCMLVVLEKLTFLSSIKRKLPKRVAKWILFISLTLCQLFVIWALWPGGYPADTIFQLYQAVGYNMLSDWHPVIHTLLEKAILLIFNNTGMIMMIQMLLFSYLITVIFMLGYENGKIPLPMLIIIGCIFEILPNQALTGCNLLKDYPFSLALLWCGYLLANLVLETPWSKKLSYYICVCLALFLVLTLRHNGIVPGIFVIIGCIVITIRQYQRLRLRLIATIVAALVSFGVYKGPLMSALNVIPNSVSPYTTMLCAVGSCISKNLPLSEETYAIMEQVMPLEDWANYYSRFMGHDLYQWGRPEGSTPYNTSSITAKEAFLVYFDALIKYPDVVIKDRLDGCDIMWDVVQPSDGFNAKTFFFLDQAVDKLPVDTNGWTQLEDGFWYKYTQFGVPYLRSIEIARNDFRDMLLWRTGAYLIALLTLFLFWGKNRLGRFLYAALPMLGNIAATALVVYHQSFRYVWFIQTGVLMLIYLTITYGKTFPLEERK